MREESDEYFTVPLNVWLALAISLISTIALLFLPSLLEPSTKTKVVQVGSNKSNFALEKQTDLLEQLQKDAKEIKKKCDDSPPNSPSGK